MQKIIMLGTGMGITKKLCNTCFAIQNDDEYFLIDTGGGIKIIENLDKAGIGLDKIHNIFISHCHTDHILGLFWILKIVTGMITGVLKGKHNGDLTIYCNSDKRSNSINLPKSISKTNGRRNSNIFKYCSFIRWRY